MLKSIKCMQRGDTIIEVLFAVTVFSLVAVGGLSIMNQGITTSQRSLEITLVRQEIDSQAEALRFLNDSYVASYQPNSSYSSNTPAGQWTLMLASIIASGTHQATAFGASNVCPVPPNGSFIINTRTAQFVPPPADKLHQAQTYAKVDYETSDDNAAVMSARGIWIEAIRSGTSPDSNQTNAGYIDFHIMACWSSPGQSVPVTIGTIVRLYEPRG